MLANDLTLSQDLHNKPHDKCMLLLNAEIVSREHFDL